MESNTIMPFCKIGNNVLIWVNNDIAHHMVIEDHVTITSHCAIGGNVIIKEQSFIGLNSTIRNNIVIGKCSIIGAATNVTKNINDFSLVMGNPSKSREMDSRNINLL
jgi:acyl-[acyl carrier protein]--UDP-N-acetylglucosamine O-acyltransferase